jgi:hypothetical protein
MNRAVADFIFDPTIFKASSPRRFGPGDWPRRFGAGDLAPAIWPRRLAAAFARARYCRIAINW